jgi:general secretion pathway protein J
MTLIEVLVALSVLSLLSAGMITTFRVAQRTYDRVSKVDRTYWDVVVAQRFMRDTLESAYPFESDAADPVPALEGTEERLVVTAPGRLAENATGFRRVSFFTQPRADGLEDLVVSSEPDRNGRVAHRAGASPVTETLIPQVKSVEWAYLDPSQDATWRNRWADRRAPPLVRLKVTFPPGDSRRWPDLIVSPRITDDANCRFDAVAQVCRQPQS